MSSKTYLKGLQILLVSFILVQFVSAGSYVSRSLFYVSVLFYHSNINLQQDTTPNYKFSVKSAYSCLVKTKQDFPSISISDAVNWYLLIFKKGGKVLKGAKCFAKCCLQKLGLYNNVTQVITAYNRIFLSSFFNKFTNNTTGIQCRKS